MPGRAGGSRGSAPSIPHLNEARPTAMSSEGLSGRRGAPTGAKVRVVTFVIFQDIFDQDPKIFWSGYIRYNFKIFWIFLTKIFKTFLSSETFLLINPYKIYNQKI
jgi:hypothetical protein